MKNLPTDEGDEEENRKIISADIINEKTFQPGLRIEKEKPRLVERGGTWFGRWGTWMIRAWMIRDLDDEGLGQNKVLCSSSRDKLPWSTTIYAPRQRSPRQENRSLASCRLPTLEPHWFGFFLVASSLSPLLCYLFLVASSLSPHLACSLTRSISCPCFCFARS